MEKNSKKRKFNIIDIVVVVLIVAVLCFVGWKVLGSRDGDGVSYKLTYQVRVDNVEPASYDCVAGFGTPYQLVANTSLVPESYVVDIECQEIPTGIIMKYDDEAETVTPMANGGVSLVFTIEAVITDPVNNTVATQNVRVGADNTVKTRDYEFDGTVIALEKEVIS